jgi:hypothetical protein
VLWVGTVLVLLFLPHRLVWETGQSPPFFASSAASAIPANGVAVVAPIARDGHGARSMLWQVASGFRFRTPGGYVWTPYSGRATPTIPDGLSPPDRPVIDALVAAETAGLSHLGSAQAAAVRADLARWGASVVIVGPMPNEAAAVSLMTDVLRRPPLRTGGVYLWSLHS